MKRNKTHVVQPARDKNKNMRITIPSDELMRMDRAARREADIASGTFIRGGVHGGGKNERNKRDRRDARQQTRRFERGQDD